MENQDERYWDYVVYHFLISQTFLLFFFLLFHHAENMHLVVCRLELIDLSLCVFHLAVKTEHQQCAPKEFFITDVAYCEQALIFLKQAKLPQNNTQRRKDDGTLPVSMLLPLPSLGG